MSSDYTNIIGTIIGVFAGWFLGLLSNSGKVRFYITNYSVDYFEKNTEGSWEKKKLNENSGYGEFSFELDISNTSRSNRMLREIYCSLYVDKEKYLKFLNDSDTVRIASVQYVYDKLNILNIHSQDIVKKRLNFLLDKNDLTILKNSKISIYFHYTRLWGLKRKRKIFITNLVNGSI